MMERIHALIDKLYEQKNRGGSPAQLLMTLQLLQAELVQLQGKNGTLGTAKVAVTLPVSIAFTEEALPAKPPAAAPPQPAAAPPPAPAAREEKPEPPAEKPAPPQEEIKPAPPERSEYLLRKPAVTEHTAEEPVSPYAPQPVLNPAFTATVETPTLPQQPTQKELHELIGEKKESLNDRLKEEKKEVAHSLKDVPIRDLRKGIGINDRFTFVNELFRGDESMYERSIKIINGFHILSEAEYWINRELKFKLGWNDSKETVQHFYQLVRRRFS